MALEALTRAAMAEVARSLGHPEIKERRIEKWTTEDRLLPEMELVGYEGKRPLWAYPAGADAQLAAVLRWREASRSIEAIRVALWAEGYGIPTEASRASMLAVLDMTRASIEKQLRRFDPAASLDEPKSPATRRALQALARQAAGKRGRGDKRPPIPRGTARLSRQDRIRAVDLLFRTFLGLAEDPAEADWAHVERLTGLSYGRRGMSPEFKWLEGSAREVTGAAFPRFTFPAIRHALEEATDRQLEQARIYAQILLRGLPFAAAALHGLGQPNAAGLEHLIALNDLDAEGVAAFVAGLVLVTTQVDLAENFRGLATQLRVQGFLDIEQLRDLGDDARDEALAKIERDQERRELKRLLHTATPADRRFPSPPRAPAEPPSEGRSPRS